MTRPTQYGIFTIARAKRRQLGLLTETTGLWPKGFRFTDYPTREEAEAARATLPEALQDITEVSEHAYL